MADMYIYKVSTFLCTREELEQRLSQIKAQFSETRCSLLHQLHGEQVRLQEQTEQHCREMGAWEARVEELEQEVRMERLHGAERLGEEQVQICSSAVQERRKLEEKHQEEVRQLRECICKMQDQAELQCRAEEESLILQRQLEEKLEEMCVQLEDNTMSMKAQDALIQSLTSELHAKEREMDFKKESEQKLLGKVSQLERKINFEREKKLSQQKVEKNKEEVLLGKVSQLEQKLVEGKKREEELLDKLCQSGEEWDCMKIELEMVQKEKERIQGNCNHLSSILYQQEKQLKAQEKELDELGENLEKTHEALKSRDEDLTMTASELHSVEMDRNRLMEELGSQSNVVKDLQARLQNLSEDWDQLNDDIQNLQNALSQERGTTAQLQTLLHSEQEEKSHLLQENSSYRNLSDQLSSQIVEMENDSTKLTEDLKELRVEIQHRDKQLLELRTQLDAKSREIDLLWNEVHLKVEMFQNVNHLSDEVRLLAQRLEDKEKELCFLKEEADNVSNQLQQTLMDSQAKVEKMEEAFEWEKGQMKGQLLEMERLVIALETVMDPSSPHRLVNRPGR